MSARALPVIIVGAGPTGLTAAALLADYGVPSVILERFDDVYPQPRAVHLDDEVYRILARLGVADEFAAISRPALGLRLVTRDLRTIAEFSRVPDGGVHGFPTASMFDQPVLERLLRSAVARRGDMVTVRGGVEVFGIDQGSDAVIVNATDRHTRTRLSIQGCYVLGCDGASSVTRTLMGTGWRELGFSQRWLVVDVDTSVDLRQWDGVHQVCDVHRAATYMRVGETRYRWEFQLLDHESAEDFSDIESVAPLLQPWLHEVSGAETTPESDVTPKSDFTLVRSAEYTFRARVARRWRDRRVFLLGDAAHLTPPFIGQGMGAGLRDAANISWKIAAAISGTVPDASLDSYECERIPHVNSMIRLAVATGAAMTGGGRAGDTVRGFVAPTLTRFPFFSDRLTDSATPALRTSYYVRRGLIANRLPRLALLVGRSGSQLAGMLAPNAVVVADGGRLDDYVTGFGIISVDAVDDDQLYEITRRGATALVVDVDSPLGKWMLNHHARSVVVRPDGTVMAAGASTAAIYTLLPTVVGMRERSADALISP